MVQARRLARELDAARRKGETHVLLEELDEGFRTKQVRPEEFSLRELFEALVPDGREIIDSWNPRHGGGGYSVPEMPRSFGQAGRPMRLMETASNVGVGAFAHITGQIAINAVMEAFQMEGNVFTPLVRTIPTNLSGERIPGIGRIGNQAAVVEEGQPYPRAGVNEDWIDTPVTTKSGMILGVTKEAMFFDRTFVLLERCREVGEFLAVNKEIRIIDCVIDENVTAHRYNWKGNVIATYGDNSGTHSWDNLTATNALVDWTDIDNAEQTMAGITDPNTGLPILVRPRHLVVTRDLLYTARRVVNATEITVVTPGYATSANPTETRTRNPIENYEIVSSLLMKSRLGTDSSWFIGDLNKAFAYMENWPVTVVQAPSNNQAEFERDVAMQWKASERGAAATIEPRYMHKSTA